MVRLVFLSRTTWAYTEDLQTCRLDLGTWEWRKNQERYEVKSVAGQVTTKAFNSLQLKPALSRAHLETFFPIRVGIARANQAHGQDRFTEQRRCRGATALRSGLSPSQTLLIRTEVNVIKFARVFFNKVDTALRKATICFNEKTVGWNLMDFQCGPK